MSSKKKYFLTTKQLASLFVSRWKIYLLPFLFLFLFFTFIFPVVPSQTFRPHLTLHHLPLLPIHNSRHSELLFQFKVVDQILFPDHVLLLTSNNLHSRQLFGLQCIYHIQQKEAEATSSTNEVVTTATATATALSLLSVDEYNDLESIVRCPSPPTNNYSTLVSLQGNRGVDQVLQVVLTIPFIPSWDCLVYGAVLDGQTAVVFAKGLNLRADRASDASQFNCYFGWGKTDMSTRYVLTTKAVTAAQEVVRCLLPKSLWKLPAKAHGVRVTLGIPSSTNHHTQASGRLVLEALDGGSRLRLPSVAKLIDLKSEKTLTNNDKYELCVCTMVWNQAPALEEWISYHTWLGVQRWFVYDNNSDDGIEDVINELEQQKFNVSRHVWPWVKTQEAGFSHCALRAKNECKWVGFIDVDEYFYFPIPTLRHHPTTESVYPGQNSLGLLVAEYSLATTVGEIRTACHSFGPSGLTRIPQRGVTVGYTCRLQSPERHKSIVRPEALDDTLLTVVHHFHLRHAYRTVNLPQSTAVLNHYKYQVWESFRAKFLRRVATYVADWQDNQNEGSRDRAPGLGTEAIEPPNWSHQFCEVWDTGLKDFIMANLADKDSGMLPWERSLT